MTADGERERRGSDSPVGQGPGADRLSCPARPGDCSVRFPLSGGAGVCSPNGRLSIQ